MLRTVVAISSQGRVIRFLEAKKLHKRTASENLAFVLEKERRKKLENN